MDLLREKLRARGLHCPMKGGSNTTQSNPTTTNTDRRLAVQDGLGVTGDGNDLSSRTTTTVNDYSQRADAAVLSKMAAMQGDAVKALANAGVETAAMQGDAVKALANAGADMVRRSQDAIVDLTATSTAANRASWDSTVSHGAALIDKLIDQSTATLDAAKDFARTGNQLAETAVKAYMPTENKNSDSLKWGLMAAAAMVAAVLMGKTK